MSDSDAVNVRAKFDRFRILIIGRANSGKTTILQAVCGTDQEPEVYDERGPVTVRPQPPTSPSPTPHPAKRSILSRFFSRKKRGESASTGPVLAPTADRGEHNINYELIFPGTNGFIFHDSRGFESGAVRERDIVQEFIRKRANHSILNERIHAIWYCFPVDTNRFQTELEFFAQIDTAGVPVIAIFTKFDSLDADAYEELCKELPHEQAFAEAEARADQIFDSTRLHLVRSQRHPPSGEVRLRNMHEKGEASRELIQKAMSELVDKTASSLDNNVLQQFLISVQQHNVELCIKYAVRGWGISVIQGYVDEAIANRTIIIKPNKDILANLLRWFPFTWVCLQLSTTCVHSDCGYFAQSLLLVHAIGNFSSLQRKFANEVLFLLSPYLTILAGSLSLELQVLNLAAAIVITAGKAFWLKSGQITPADFLATLDAYIEGGSADQVRVAILEAFKDGIGSISTDEGKEVFTQLILDNQMQHSGAEPPADREHP
ncbi:hypothetical protein BOTBODRAFT_30974 [Botryobasidium botryosum FD-172 SS1]|uniref:G domain-containing protein n=1 Tax=Botryobasidium botryosum (strain FD-172 SS1) TaxID=930990 RepID=A0A067ML50_BOTB1|nr:hypothetical protein BOTBODRAFT_30974 [Botryobasidium botryosum FD-172 SS1]